MGKRITYTKITPLPSNVPRQLAIELLHSHEEVIQLNPLVTGVQNIEAPRDAANDEYFSSWYEISEIITWGLGLKKKISFKGVFHNLPYGLQSHVYVPMGVDLRNKYKIGGNQPGEPREARELGVDKPMDGLYLREDHEITCNLALASFVKKEMKEATGKMIERLVRKAELVDEGKLHAMFEEGKLKTAKPTFSDTEGSVTTGSPPGSPAPSTMSGLASPRLDKRGFGNYHDVARSASQHRTSQYLSDQGYARPGAEMSGSMPMINELPGDLYHPQGSPSLYPGPLRPQAQENSFRSELPGDMSFATSSSSPQPSPRLPEGELKPPVQYQAYLPPAQQHPSQRNSFHSTQSSSPAQTPELQQRTADYSGQPSSNIAQWQSNVANSSQLSVNRQSVADSYQAEISRHPNSLIPDHQRFSQLSVQQTPPPPPPAQPSATYGSAAAANAKCPVCGLFEGDEAAVSHHVSKAHFS